MVQKVKRMQDKDNNEGEEMELSSEQAPDDFSPSDTRPSLDAKKTASLDNPGQMKDRAIIPFLFIPRSSPDERELEGAYRISDGRELKQIFSGDQLVLIPVDVLTKIVDGLHASYYQIIGFMKAYNIPKERIWSILDPSKEFLQDLLWYARRVEIFLRDDDILIEETNPLFVLDERTSRDWIGTDDWL